MKGFKRRLSWLLVITMILSQASFASFADNDDDEYDYEIPLVNDLFVNGLGGDRSLGRTVYGRQNLGEPVKEVKWTDAAPKVTSEELTWKSTTYTAYYANGQPITIVASASDAGATYIVEDNGAYTKLEGANPYIYGGATASNASYASTKITMNDGEVFAIVGSNRFTGNVGKTDITLNGGTVAAIHANEGSSPRLSGTQEWNDAGAASFAACDTYQVGEANIVINGGTVKDKIDGSHGHNYTKSFNLTVNGGEVQGNVMAGGTNGKVGTAVVTVNGGMLNDVSAGYRAFVKDATFHLNSGKINDIFAGSWYPDAEKSDKWIAGNWKAGDVDYGKAEKLAINIGETLTYSGLYAGFQLMKSEIEEYNKKYGDQEDAKMAVGFFDVPTKGAVTVSVAKAPSVTEGEDNILNKAGYEKYQDYVNLTLPSVKVEGGTAEVSDQEALAITTENSLHVLPGTNIAISANVPDDDHLFSEWSGSVEFDDPGAIETSFTMPNGLVERVITANFVDKEFHADETSIELDLYDKESGNNTGIVTIYSDYAAPSVIEYDQSVVAIEQTSDGTGSGEWEYSITAIREGATTIVFGAEGTSKMIELPVTVIDSTPVLTVEGGVIVSIDNETLEGIVTSGKIPEGTDVVIRADAVDDKKFTGWSGAAVSEDGSMKMPERNTTVAARYEDKVFRFAAGTGDEVTLNVDQSETNVENLPNTFTFEIESDYSADRIAVRSTNDKIATVKANADGSYTVQAAGAGMATILATLTKDSGTITMHGITVNVADTTKKTEAGNGNAAINTENTEFETPEMPEGVDEEKAAELEAELEIKVEEAISSIAENEAAKTGVTGFDRVPESALLEAGIPAGASVIIYPKQELKKVETIFTESKSIDPTTNTEIVTYIPVVKKIVFDIKPYAASTEGSGTEKVLANIRGNFRFRIPVPSTIGLDARYALLTHISDQGGVVSNNRYLPIQEENGQKYVNVSTNHFSTFELEFTSTSPESSFTGGGGGGGSRTTTFTGKWILDATGWWYQYADKTYPANGWAYLTYATNENRWYHFDANGYMQTGWFVDTTGHRYYLHPISDGTKGHMYTGWHEIDGKWYYFSTTTTDTNPVGSLLVSTTTPDGHQVGADGARIQ